MLISTAQMTQNCQSQQTMNKTDGKSKYTQLIHIVKKLFEYLSTELKLLCNTLKKLSFFTFFKSAQQLEPTCIHDTKKNNGTVKNIAYQSNEEIRYSGQMRQGKPHGKGTLLFRNSGTHLNAYFEKGKLINTQGDLLAKSGKIKFKATLNEETNQLEGHLKLEKQDDYLYEGAFNDKMADSIWQPEGSGYLKNADGTKTCGTFLKGCLVSINESPEGIKKVDQPAPVLTELQRREEEKPYPLAVSYHKMRLEKLKELSLDLWNRSLKGIIDRLIILGDSTTDTGNMHAKTGGIILSKKDRYPNGRFTNGHVWPDYFHSFEQTREVEMINLAQGGSCAEDPTTITQKIGLYSTIGRQFDQYVKEHQTFNESDIVMIRAIENDFLLFKKLITDVDKIIDSVLNVIRLAADKGVKNFIISGAFNMGETPAAKGKETELTAITNAYNEKMQLKLEELQKELDIRVEFLDMRPLEITVSNLAERLGYSKDKGYFETNEYIKRPSEAITDAMAGILGYVKNQGSFEEKENTQRQCKKQLPYLFYDKVHLVHEMHQILASFIADFILEKWGTCPDESSTTDQAESSTTDQAESSTTDQAESSTTDQAESSTTDQAESSTTDQAESSTTNQEESSTTNQEESNITDK
ncbi:MAG: SGNH/GDSL hydrolase family protein [Endozoicomonadaceae bacterium]|nr:SGNH/GDSL hydrolase family protein [Endozoicomonadaceae bacterium]